jgi:hypothetical protein
MKAANDKLAAVTASGAAASLNIEEVDESKPYIAMVRALVESGLLIICHSVLQDVAVTELPPGLAESDADADHEDDSSDSDTDSDGDVGNSDGLASKASAPAATGIRRSAASSHAVGSARDGRSSDTAADASLGREPLREPESYVSAQRARSAKGKRQPIIEELTS